MKLLEDRGIIYTFDEEWGVEHKHDGKGYI